MDANHKPHLYRFRRKYSCTYLFENENNPHNIFLLVNSFLYLLCFFCMVLSNLFPLPSQLNQNFIFLIPLFLRLFKLNRIFFLPFSYLFDTFFPIQPIPLNSLFKYFYSIFFIIRLMVE